MVALNNSFASLVRFTWSVIIFTPLCLHFLFIYDTLPIQYSSAFAFEYLPNSLVFALCSECTRSHELVKT